MPVNDELGKRMKENYENVSKTRLTRRTPVAIRIDGKAFHTFTKGFKRPFDEILIKSMQETMKYLCENIQGCVLGYTQSDEITLILVDYKNLNSSAWFDYEVQKMCSISASMATMGFNKYFIRNAEKYISNYYNKYFIRNAEEYISNYYEGWNTNPKEEKYCEVLEKAIEKGAMFDARVFNIPKEEVTNLIYWRQLDATRNSIQMVGQANFSHKELQNKTCNNIQDMLMTQKSLNWNDFPVYLKRGSCCIKEEYNSKSTPKRTNLLPSVLEYSSAIRTHWVIDKNIPIFRNEGRDYIEKLINF